MRPATESRRSERSIRGGTRSFVDALLSIGTYAEESETQRARRRIILATTWVASLLTALTILSEFVSRLFWVALSDTGILAVTAVTLIGLHLKPRRFALIINLLLGTVFVVGLIKTALFAGSSSRDWSSSSTWRSFSPPCSRSGTARHRGGSQHSWPRSSTRP